MNHRIASGILGAADGVTSIAGVIAGGAASGTSHGKVAVIAIGGALAATVSMAGAELLSEDTTDWRSIEAMGAGTLLGSALPALPLLIAAGRAAWIAVVLISIVLGLLVGFVRARTCNRPIVKAVLQTLAVLGTGAVVGYGAGRL